MRPQLTASILVLLPVSPALLAEIIGRAFVIDGDTLKIHGDSFRLLGIDAPERDQTCERVGKRYRCSRAATAALHDLIRAGEPVQCVTEGRDRYQRWIAECVLEGLSLNRWTVASGHALAYRKYSLAQVRDKGRARLRGLGLWQGDFAAPWDHRKWG